MGKLLKWLAFVIGGCGALFNLPALVRGFSFLWEWVRVQTSNGPYFHWPYLVAGSIFVLFSTLGLGLAARAFWGKSFRILASVASLLLGLGCAVELPEVDPKVAMSGATQRILGHADHSLSDWDEEHGTFPSNEGDLRKALAVRPLKEPAIYLQHRNPIPYDIRMLTNATGPSAGAVPSTPGTVVYAVSSNYKDYWLTMTTLSDPVAGAVAWEHVAGLNEREPIWAIHRKHHNPGEGYQPFIE
jgi:hypothetical protein